MKVEYHFICHAKIMPALTKLNTYGLSFREHGMSCAFAFEPDSPECGICTANRYPNLSPVPKINKKTKKI